MDKVTFSALRPYRKVMRLIFYIPKSRDATLLLEKLHAVIINLSAHIRQDGKLVIVVPDTLKSRETSYNEQVNHYKPTISNLLTLINSQPFNV